LLRNEVPFHVQRSDGPAILLRILLPGVALRPEINSRFFFFVIQLWPDFQIITAGRQLSSWSLGCPSALISDCLRRLFPTLDSNPTKATFKSSHSALQGIASPPSALLAPRFIFFPSTFWFQILQAFLPAFF
jgi:hypothetical protein